MEKERGSELFTNLKKSELCDIYLDYCLSKKEGRRCESFVSFAEQYRVEIQVGELLPLGEAINIVARMFFEETANRYFKEGGM